MKRNEIEGNQVVGSLCIKYPWPGIARTIWVIISVIKKRILLPFQANISLVTDFT
jgi:acyl-coenzyme A synthetase/AMP-(fatty) acid ligase